jgi:hypothetical protein
MKTIYLMGILIGLIVLTGCAKDITQAEAAGIATSYVIEQVGFEETVEVHGITLKSDGWYVQLILGDDKGTVILDKKGNFVKLETYKWV